MSLSFGNKSIKDVYYGNKKITKIYKGSKLVYSSTPTIKYRVFFSSISKNLCYIDSDDLTTFYECDITNFGSFSNSHFIRTSEVLDNSSSLLIYIIDTDLSQQTSGEQTYNIMYSTDRGLTWKKSVLPDNFYATDNIVGRTYAENKFFLLSNLAVKGDGQTFETITTPIIRGTLYYDLSSSTLGIHPYSATIYTTINEGNTWIRGSKETTTNAIEEIVPIPSTLSSKQLYLLLSSTEDATNLISKYTVISNPFSVIGNLNLSTNGNNLALVQTTSIVDNQFAWVSNDFKTLYYVNPDTWTEGMTLEFKTASVPSGVSTFSITSIGDRFLLIPNTTSSINTTTLYTSKDLTSGSWKSHTLKIPTPILYSSVISSIKI